MTNKAFAKQIFEQHPLLMKVHVTSDGQFFGIENHAHNHAATLDDKTILNYAREDVMLTEKILDNNHELKKAGFVPGETLDVGANIPSEIETIDQVDTFPAQVNSQPSAAQEQLEALKDVGQVGGKNVTTRKRN